jgi:hypothetical protein
MPLRFVLVKRFNLWDVSVCSLLVGLGVLAIVFSCRAPDVVDTSIYYDLTKSIVNQFWYGFNFKAQSTLPPGFPLILAAISVTIGSSYAVLVRSLAVFTTLALLAAYDVLRTQEGRWVAAVSCLLLGSSPSLFFFSTRLLLSDMPYFLTSMLFLCLALRLENVTHRTKAILVWLACAVLLAGSILLRTTGTAFLIGIVGWFLSSRLTRNPETRRRIKIFLPLVAVGVVTQAGWTFWAGHNRVSEWPLRGYPESYVLQLELKNGNDPELGLATWKDVLARPIENLDSRAAALVTLLTRKGVPASWYSAVTVIPVFLTVLGLAYSFRRTGGNLVDWYFLSYEAMFLFWPWDFDLRFFLPIAPLACLYVWRGGAQLWRWCQAAPGRVGAAGVAVAAACAIGGSLAGWPAEKTHGKWSLLLWLLVAAGFAVLLTGRWWTLRQRMSKRLRQPVQGTGLKVWQVATGAIVTALFIVGVGLQLRIGLDNIHFDLSQQSSYPDIEAAEWVKAHSDPGAVVMARQEDLVYHYCQHRVVWFPPSTDAHLLMDGIRRYHIKWVIVVDRQENYWRPSDEKSFESLAHDYQRVFVLVHQGPHNKVYAVSQGDDLPLSTHS